MPVIDISKDQLIDKLKENPDKLEIIDVREPDEYRLVHLKKSKLIPMSELPSRLAEINWDKEVVFICRSGSRSKMMAMLASSRTGEAVGNLRYGIYECYQDPEKCAGNLVADEDMVGRYF